MTESVYSKLDIAYEYLETAMQLYVEGKAYFSAMHLAGAAQELFGRHLPEDERISAIALKAQIAMQVIDGHKAIEYAAAHDKQGKEYKSAKDIVLRSKNKIKHMNDDGSDNTVTMNPAYMAGEWVELALIDFEAVKEKHGYKLGLHKSPAMWAFEHARRKALGA